MLSKEAYKRARAHENRRNAIKRREKDPDIIILINKCKEEREKRLSALKEFNDKKQKKLDRLRQL